MEGTLLERVYLTGGVSGAFGKYPQLDLLVPDLLRGGVKYGSRFLGIHSVDEDQTAQPCTKADRPRIENLLFGDNGAFVHHRPQIEHPQDIQ